MLAAALEEGVVSESDTFYCSGSCNVAGTASPSTAPSATGHGIADPGPGGGELLQPRLYRRSASGWGVEKFYDYLEAFGMTEQTGIDLPGEAARTVWTGSRET